MKSLKTSDVNKDLDPKAKDLGPKAKDLGPKAKAMTLVPRPSTWVARPRTLDFNLKCFTGLFTSFLIFIFCECFCVCELIPVSTAFCLFMNKLIYYCYY